MEAANDRTDRMGAADNKTDRMEGRQS